MLICAFLISVAIATTSLSITEPVDGETYDGDWLTIRAIIENNNELPEYVQYTLNGQIAIDIPRLNTDWYTYMANDLHTGFSESPAPNDNTILWTAQVTGDFHEFPSPVVVDGMVYYPSDRGTDSLYALDAVTGDLIWKYRTGSTDDAVTVKDGYLYTASDSVWCLDALTGERIWANGDADWSGSTPAVINGRVYCMRNSPGCCVYSLNAETGTEIWSNLLPTRTISCLTVWNDMVFVPTCNTTGEAALYALDAGSGLVIWENTDSEHGYWDSSPVVVDSLIYINGFDGKARAIHALTGIIVWETDFSHTYDITATSAYHDGRLYFATQYLTNIYYCLDASNGSTIWSVPGCTHGSSGIADGIIFYGEDLNTDNARVMALDWNTGETIWFYETGNTQIYSSPAITDGVVYIAGMDWNLYAFGTGLKYTYLDDLYARVGSNELIATSFEGATAVAADTVHFTVTGTGINLEPSHLLGLSASPNPFYFSSFISFVLSKQGFTSVGVYDLSGRVICSLENEVLVAGPHSYVWDGKSKDGEPVSAGLYFCRIQSVGISETTGLCLLR